MEGWAEDTLYSYISGYFVWMLVVKLIINLNIFSMRVVSF